MKNFYKNISARTTHILTLTLIISLFISISFLIRTKSELYKYTIKKNIKGTYMYISDFSQIYWPDPDAQYFTFYKDKFYRYKQLELIQKGTYRKTNDDIYILKNNNSDDDYIIYNTNTSIYFYNRKENNIFKFWRISDIPSFINIDVD